MNRQQMNEYRKRLLIEHEHLLRLLYMAIVKVGTWNESTRRYVVVVGGFILVATDTRRLIAYAGNIDNTPFVEVLWDNDWHIEREGSYIVPGKWIEKARAFVDNALAEVNIINDNLISKMIHTNPEIEKIELEP